MQIANCFKVTFFFSVLKRPVKVQWGHYTAETQAHADPLFMQHSVRLPARSVCQCVPGRPGHTFGPRQWWAGGLYSRSLDAHWSTGRGHWVQQIMSIKCGPRAWNTVKPNVRGREGGKRGFNRDSACVWSMLLHISNVMQISSPTKPRSSCKRAVSQRENEPWVVQKTAYSYTTLMRCQWGANTGWY